MSDQRFLPLVALALLLAGCDEAQNAGHLDIEPSAAVAPSERASTRALGFNSSHALDDDGVPFESSQGYARVFDADGELVVGAAFDDWRHEGEWAVMTRNGVTVSWENNDDMHNFQRYFLLNGEQVSTVPYMVTTVAIDADGRAWAALHASASQDSRERRMVYQVYDPDGTPLFAMTLPKDEGFVDAKGDRVLTVFDVTPERVSQVVRRITQNRPNVVGG